MAMYYNPMQGAALVSRSVENLGESVSSGIQSVFDASEEWKNQKARTKNSEEHMQLLYDNAVQIAADYGIDSSGLPKPRSGRAARVTTPEEFATLLGEVLKPKIDRIKNERKTAVIHQEYGGGQQQQPGSPMQQGAGVGMDDGVGGIVDTPQQPQPPQQPPQTTGAAMPVVEAAATPVMPTMPASPMAPKKVDVDEDYAEFLESQKELDRRTLALMDAGVINQDDAVKSLTERHKQRGDLIKARIDERKKSADIDRTKTAESLIDTHQKRGQVYNKTTGKPITAADYADIRANPVNYLVGTPPFAPQQAGFGMKMESDAMKMAENALNHANSTFLSYARIKDPETDELIWNKKFLGSNFGRQLMGNVAAATLAKDLTAQSGDYARSFSAVTNNVDVQIQYNPDLSGQPYYTDSEKKDIANLANPDMLKAVKEVLVKGGSVANLIRVLRSRQGLPR